MFIIPIVIIAVLALYVLSIYNKLATMRVRIVASIQEIGNQLKRQAQLLPNLADIFKGAKKQEKDIFKMLTDARKTILEAIKSGNGKAIDASQQNLQQTLGQLKVIMESNPQMQSISTLPALVENLRDTADKIMYSRRVMIDLSADYNIILVTFPSNLVAKLFGFRQTEGLKTPTTGEFLEVSEVETKTPDLDLDK